MPDLDKLLAAIDAAEANSYGGDSDGDLSADRAYAIDLYLGRNVDPVPEGRSSVIDRSVFETVQWILPSLCRIFANGEDLVELIPLGPDDEQSAKQESEYLNYVITQKNKWGEVFLTWATDALVTKNAYCMAFINKRRQVETERYKGLSEVALASLVSDGVEVIAANQYQDGTDLQQGPDGQPVEVPRLVYDVEIRRTKVDEFPCLRVLPPERVKVDENTATHRLMDCDYFEYWETKTLSQLRAEGFDIPDDIADGSEDGDTLEDDARDMFDSDYGRDGGGDVDPSMRRVKVRCIWIRHDYDEDGIAELQYCVRIGQDIIYREETSRIPVACLVPIPLPHRHIGLSVADITADIQRIKTAILRQGLDNLYLANNPRTFATDKVNLDDLLISRPGGVIRGEPGAIFGQDLAVFQQPFVFPQAMQGLEYMDQVRENRTGTNRYFTGIDQNALNKTATGIQQLSTMAAQRVEQIARIFASGVEDLCSIVHELILRNGHKKEVVKLRGNWVEVDPSTWRKRSDFRISVGFAAGNKDAQVGRLMMIAQLQEKALAGGLPIVTPQNVYETALELTKASDFTAPERFWTDPATVPPQEPAPNPLAEVEQIKAQSQAQIKAAELQQRDREAQLDAQMKQYAVDKDAEVKLWLKRMELGGAIDLESFRAQVSLQNEDAKIGKAREATAADRQELASQFAQFINEALSQATNAQVAQISQVIGSIGNLIGGERRVVKDANGRATHIEIVGPDGEVMARHAVVRDGNGRVIGSKPN